jgi:hypothetical protein
MMYRTQENIKEGAKYSWREDFQIWLPSVIIFPLALYVVLNRGEYTWIDNDDLVIHEAGHVFFSLFGKFIYTAGGTLMQILLHGLLIWHFFRNHYKTGIQFSLLWLGQNLVNISVYAADARSQQLPLLGGNKVYHDWHYLLGELNILQYDTEVGYFIFGAAILAFIIAILLPLFIHD